MSQGRFINDVLTRFNMDQSSHVNMPMTDPKILFDEGDDKESEEPYQAAIGSLIYTAMSVRPDILFPTILLSRFNNKHKLMHWAAVK